MTLSRLRDPRGLDELLNYRLSRLLTISGAPAIRLCEGRYRISRREWRLMATLAAHGELSPSVLAERAYLDRARTSRCITGLAAKQLLRRVALAGDRRQARVALTEAGCKLVDELLPQVAEINRRVVSVLDDELLDKLDDALLRLTAQAVRVNRELAQDVSADRRKGGRSRGWPDPDDD